jgi:hypothetical protein
VEAHSVFPRFVNPYFRAVLVGILTPILLYVSQLPIHARHAGWTTVLAVGSVAVLVAHTVLIATRSHTVPLLFLALRVLGTSLWLVLLFTSVYWHIGTAKNFGQSLTHLDATYFTVGTLTTTGTGTISPQSQSARLLVTVQYAVDLVFLAVVLSVFAGRLAAERNTQ